MQVNSIGIIGYGAMGKIIQEVAENYLDSSTVLIYEKENSQDLLKKAVNADIIFLCVPVDAYEKLLPQISELSSNMSSIIISIAAVMEHPETIIKQHLSLPALIAHPLFGPASYSANKKKLLDLEVAISSLNISQAELTIFNNWLANLGLQTKIVSAYEHDKIMAKSHYIPFLLSHALKSCEIPDVNLKTKSAEKLLDFLNLTSINHGCLNEILKYNQYAKEALSEFKDKLDEISK